MNKKTHVNVTEVEDVTVNREYKSTVFAMLFDDQKKLLSLYNALNHSHYSNPEELEIVTLINAVYLGMKNDKAFVLDYWLNMYEHQSTPNPNMPLRHLFYVTREYGRLVELPVLYRRRPIKIPTPRFVVFYNGMDKQPERQMLKLSELYAQPEEEPMLELKVEFLNINAGYNEELKEACGSLREYCLFVERVRRYTFSEETLEKAVEQAVKECIEEGILKEFLIANRAEVMAMSILEFTLEDWKALQEEERELARKEARQEGLEEGHRKGCKEGERIGEERQKEKGLKALVNSLQKCLPDFEELYKLVVSNEEYKDYTKEQVRKYYS